MSACKGNKQGKLTTGRYTRAIWPEPIRVSEGEQVRLQFSDLDIEILRSLTTLPSETRTEYWMKQLSGESFEQSFSVLTSMGALVYNDDEDQYDIAPLGELVLAWANNNLYLSITTKELPPIERPYR